MQTLLLSLGIIVGFILRILHYIKLFFLVPIILIVDFLLWLLTCGLYKGMAERNREADGLREIKTLEEGLAKARSPEDVFVMCKHQPPPSLRFQKSEKVLWVLPDCRYLKIKKHTTFSGGSLDASFGVTRNIDVGIGRLGGSLDEGERLEQADEGTVVLTTQHIYFHGQRWERHFPERTERFRVRLDKLASVSVAEGHADRLMFQRDGEGSRPECFESNSMACARTLDKLLLWLKESELVIASSGTDVDAAADFGDADFD